MELQKLNVKFFVDERDQVPLTTFIDIFHSWIQASDGIYYDVADYRHMAAGPGIVLVAHEANISIDETGGRQGLLYNRKQLLRGSNQEKLRAVFRAALDNCRRIEDEPSLQGKFKFIGSEVLFLINDRLIAPNTEEIFLAIKPELEGLGRLLYGGADFALVHHNDRKRRFSVQMEAPVAFDVGTLLKNMDTATSKEVLG